MLAAHPRDLAIADAFLKAHAGHDVSPGFVTPRDLAEQQAELDAELAKRDIGRKGPS